MAYSLSEKITLIHKRIGLKNMRALLGNPHSIRAVGIAEFAQKFEQAALKDPKIEQAVDDLWNQLIFGGKRLIQIWKCDNTEFTKITDFLAQLKPDLKNSLTDQYPLPGSNLAASDRDFHFTEERTFKSRGFDLRVFMFCVKTKYTATEEIEDSLLSTDGLDLKKHGAKIFYKSVIDTLCYNFIALDATEKHVILGVDTSELPSNDAVFAALRLKDFIRDKTSIFLDKPINFFPAIENLYQAKDGSVTSISFLTSDGNTSSLSIKSGQSCLRQDTYHHGGETAAKILSKFKLNKNWQISKPASQHVSIGLELPGKRIMLDTSVPLTELNTTACPSIDELAIVIRNTLSAL